MSREMFVDSLAKIAERENEVFRRAFGGRPVADWGIHGKLLVFAPGDMRSDIADYFSVPMEWDGDGSGVFVASVDVLDFERRFEDAIRIGFAYTAPCDVALATAFEIRGVLRYNMFPELVQGYRVFPGFAVISPGVLTRADFEAIRGIKSETLAAVAIHRAHNIVEDLDGALKRREVAISNAEDCIWRNRS